MCSFYINIHGALILVAVGSHRKPGFSCHCWLAVYYSELKQVLSYIFLLIHTSYFLFCLIHAKLQCSFCLLNGSINILTLYWKGRNLDSETELLTSSIAGSYTLHYIRFYVKSVQTSIHWLTPYLASD